MNRILLFALALFLAACATRKSAVSVSDTAQTASVKTTAKTTATDSAFAVLSEVYDRDSMSLQWSFALISDSTGRPLYRSTIINGSRSRARMGRQNTQSSVSLADSSSTLTADTSTVKSARTETRTKRSQPPDVLIFIFIIVAAAAVLTFLKARKL